MCGVDIGTNRNILLQTSRIEANRRDAVHTDAIEKTFE